MLTDSEEEPSPPPCDYRRREWWNPLLVNREDYVPEHNVAKRRKKRRGGGKRCHSWKGIVLAGRPTPAACDHIVVTPEGCELPILFSNRKLSFREPSLAATQFPRTPLLGDW